MPNPQIRSSPTRDHPLAKRQTLARRPSGRETQLSKVIATHLESKNRRVVETLRESRESCYIVGNAAAGNGSRRV